MLAFGTSRPMKGPNVSTSVVKLETEAVDGDWEVSDEALEIAANAGQDENPCYTLGSCTGLSVCPE